MTLPRREPLGSPQLHQEVGGTLTWKRGSGEHVGAAWFPLRQDWGGLPRKSGQEGLGWDVKDYKSFKSLEALRFAFFLRLFPIIIHCCLV